MSNRIYSLSDASIINLSLRSLQNLDNAMTAYGESDGKPYGHGGALSFGWDMPTASIIFPRLYRRFSIFKAEGLRRGLTGFKYTKKRIGKRAKKNPGKIVYTLAKAA